MMACAPRRRWPFNWKISIWERPSCGFAVKATGLQANPHRFRHSFGADMVRAGISLPALMRLMGHAHIHTTMLYVQLSPQDVFAEYARAVERMAKLEQPELP